MRSVRRHLDVSFSEEAISLLHISDVRKLLRSRTRWQSCRSLGSCDRTEEYRWEFSEIH